MYLINLLIKCFKQCDKCFSYAHTLFLFLFFLERGLSVGVKLRLLKLINGGGGGGGGGGFLRGGGGGGWGCLNKVRVGRKKI